MHSPTEKIKELIVNLPEKDIKFAEKFINSRDFDSLKELVDSALYKAEKNQKSDNPKPDYINVDLDGLSVLKSEVDSYIMLLDGPEDEYEDCEEY